MDWRRPSQRRNGLRSRRTDPSTTWTKRNTCNEVALPELGAETDKVRCGGKTPDALPQRELHVVLQLTLDVLRRSQKDALGSRDSGFVFLVEDITSGLTRPRLSHFQPAVKFL